jgi:nicotinamidase-related amidase
MKWKQDMTNNFAANRLNPDDTALVLIDHQSGLMQMANDFPPAEFRNNVLALAKIGIAFGLPTVITSSAEDGPNGPIIPQILELHSDVKIVRRQGEISAWDNKEFVAAVEKTGRKKLVMAGVTMDVCLAFPAMQAVDAGYQVYGVIDASGAYDVSTQQLAVQRMLGAGIICVNWIAVGAELQRDWRIAAVDGKGLGNIFHGHFMPYSMLIDSFAHASGQAPKARAA